MDIAARSHVFRMSLLSARQKGSKPVHYECSQLCEVLCCPCNSWSGFSQFGTSLRTASNNVEPGPPPATQELGPTDAKKGGQNGPPFVFAMIRKQYRGPKKGVQNGTPVLEHKRTISSQKKLKNVYPQPERNRMHGIISDHPVA